MRKIEDILKLVSDFLNEKSHCTLEDKGTMFRLDVKDALGTYSRQHDSLDMEYLESVCTKIKVYDALVDLRKMFEKHKGE